jgi:hypothetical protein
VQEIRRKTRRKFSVEEKIRIVLEGLRGEESIATLCRNEGLQTPRSYTTSFDVARTNLSIVSATLLEGWYVVHVDRAQSAAPVSERLQA